jgi:hypothetical protein
VSKPQSSRPSAKLFPVVGIGTRPAPRPQASVPLPLPPGSGERGTLAGEIGVGSKEGKKEQPSYRNLSATAQRVLLCTCPVAASRKDFINVWHKFRPLGVSKSVT